MLESMDSALLSEYMAYDRVDGFGDEKIVFMLAQLSSLTANINGGKTKVSSFMPPERTKKIPVIDKLKAIFNGSRRNKPSSTD